MGKGASPTLVVGMKLAQPLCRQDGGSSEAVPLPAQTDRTVI